MEKDTEEDLIPDELDDSKDEFDLDGGLGGSDSFEDTGKRMDLIRELTDFSPYVRDMVNHWLGLVWNEKHKKFIENPNAIKICNETFVFWIIGYLRTYIRQTVMLSRLDEKDYKEFVGDTIELYWVNVAIKHKLYGISNPGDMEQIGNQIEHSIRMTLSTTKSGNIVGLIKDTHEYKEATVNKQDDSTPGKSMLAKSFGKLLNQGGNGQ